MQFVTAQRICRPIYSILWTQRTCQYIYNEAVTPNQYSGAGVY